MTRFNISLNDASEMVLWSLVNSFGGEVVIPKIPSFKIIDLAKSIDKNIPFEVMGVRPGEKIHEELLSSSDNLNTFDIGKYYVLLENNSKLIAYYKKKFKAKKTKKDFVYSSDNNGNFLSIKKLNEIVSNYQSKTLS